MTPAQERARRERWRVKHLDYYSAWVRRWRRRTRRELILSLGGRCEVCGTRGTRGNRLQLAHRIPVDRPMGSDGQASNRCMDENLREARDHPERFRLLCRDDHRKFDGPTWGVPYVNGRFRPRREWRELGPGPLLPFVPTIVGSVSLLKMLPPPTPILPTWDETQATLSAKAAGRRLNVEMDRMEADRA